MATQLPLNLPTRTALGRDAFFVSPSNAVALASIDNWRNWPNGKMILCGPKGAGKTHLAQVWAAESGARVIAAERIADSDISDLALTPLAIEDADRIAGQAGDEEALFHLHNMILAEGHALLITAQSPPRGWNIGLPDLKSRMEGTSLTSLDQPDDTLLAAMLTKQFADRQLKPSPEAVTFLLRNMERSAAEVERIVSRMDRRALSQGRKISRQLAVETLADPSEI
ncbi:MAG: DnaA/Hda family protein [Paracoccaceae bacterium]|jgi:chromosomal replication initiation ATPase DnaA|nr:DnaA/Hda family protein [Paracoccaceae bacterium]MDP7184625.1 DnaA/Hda family protein [Paracoccaceae bacterium]